MTVNFIPPVPELAITIEQAIRILTAGAVGLGCSLCE